MLDIKFVRENPEVVKQNIRNKFQDNKLELVDKVLELDKENREIKQEVEALRAERNKISKQIGALMAQGKKEEAEEVKRQVAASGSRIEELSAREKEVEEELLKDMMVIPNIIDPSVPIGKDDSENVEIEKFGEPVVPDFEVPYHTEIMESFDGIDLDSARRVAGNGFYYLMGDIARLHSAVISYARDFMINRGFTYCVPPFMIRSNVVTGVMSFAEMDAMMYKIEGEDLYLIGTSEHSMIGKFIDTLNPEEKLPVICVFQEVNRSNEHLAVTEASYFYEYFRIAAQGECILINFVLEDADDNELLTDILTDAFIKYPMIDQSRIYAAGHSHNGRYAYEFAVRHPDMIAAVATFGISAGLQRNAMIPMTDEKIGWIRAHDLPTIFLAGFAEHNLLYPLNRDAEGLRPWQGKAPDFPASAEERARSWQLRLKAHNCPEKTLEEIYGAAYSLSGAVRKLGIPADHSETMWLDGSEISIADIRNNEGKFHLRIVGEENMPHNTTPVQQKLSWSFMRRFARCQETGEIIERY